MQNFCSRCGARCKPGARYCSRCGAPVSSTKEPFGYAAHYEVAAPAVTPPRHASLSCVLAYVPGLFWLPLLAPRRDGLHREYANQGILLTLSFLLFGTVGALILGALWRGGYDFGQIGGLFVDFTARNWAARTLQIGGWLALTGLVMYAPINSICGIFHGMASDKPYRIAILGRLRLIGPRKHG